MLNAQPALPSLSVREATTSNPVAVNLVVSSHIWRILAEEYYRVEVGGFWIRMEFNRVEEE